MDGNIRPSIDELFSFKFSGGSLAGFSKESIEESSISRSIRFVKKPVEIRYQLKKDSFTMRVNDIQLDASAIKTLTAYGYFILEEKAFYCLPESQGILKRVEESSTLKKLLELTAELRLKKILDGDSNDIIASLINRPHSELTIESEGILKHKLYPYQRNGVNWLIYCYLNQAGAVLADDMGLGKTAQIIALIAECFNREMLTSSVIIVPNTLIENWKREFGFFCPSIKPYVHHGSIRSGLAEELEKYLVVIIPYSIMANDIEMISELNVDLLIFDEASLLKNPESDRTLSSKRIKANSVIAMTGTPVENSLMDIWSIVDLVFPSYLGSKDEFSSKYVHRTIGETLDRDLEGLEEQVRQITLRRMKVDILDDLPEKVDIHQPIVMFDDERTYSDSIISMGSLKIVIIFQGCCSLDFFILSNLVAN